MIEFCEVTKTFKSDILKKDFQALKNVSFKIPEGKIVGFLGANGAGKTTSIKIAMDFTRPTSGIVKYGASLGGSKEHAFRKIGYLPERPFFYPHLSGREFCRYMGALSEITDSRIKEQVLFWAPRFKIDFALDRNIKTYSKGMLQRLGFLVTIIHDPSLIILDEPLSGLDPIGRKELKDIILEVNRNGTTVFFSSHIVSDVEEVCDRVVFLKSGSMVYNGSVEQLLSENKKTENHIRYIENNIIKTKNIDDRDKKEFLVNAVKNDIEIISIRPKTPSLEEIFYHV